MTSIKVDKKSLSIILSAIHSGKESLLEYTESIEPQGIISTCMKLAADNSLKGIDAVQETLVIDWISFSLNSILGADFKQFGTSLNKLEEHLSVRTFLVGFDFTLADFVVFSHLKENLIWNGKKFQKENYSCVLRWFNHLNEHPLVVKSMEFIANGINSKKGDSKARDQGSFDIPLKNAEMGKVCTRFPPEPSGYMHIGHAKALLLNEYFSKKYQGKLIIRFDDTNPTKEKAEFEQTILEDIKMLEVDYQILTYTSDYFDLTYDYAIKLIKAGLAYCDDTPVEEMRENRTNGIPSKRRETSVEDNLKYFDEMKNATEKGLSFCLRAKMSVDNPNKALRDPVIYRCNLEPHHRTGSKYKMYPTYDFSCPIVDSVEGVTHAFRSNEYRDRNPQFDWFIEKLQLRPVQIIDYSRLSFNYTLLSKRKLAWFVNNGRVTGWDDARFPTVRGILRRGLTVEALKKYVLMQGFSSNAVQLEWDKIWSLNKQIIDKTAPRYTALQEPVSFKLLNYKDGIFTKDNALHKKAPELGTKKVTYSGSLLIELEDAKSISVGEEITLMDWGNAIVKSKNSANEIEAELHLEGDFKKTEKKITWLSADAKKSKAELLDYDYLLTKKYIEENDNFEDFLNPVTELKSVAVCDAQIESLPLKTIIQFERKGFYIVDKHEKGSTSLVFIPDGKKETTSLKYNAEGANPEKPKAKSKTAPISTDSGIKMYYSKPYNAAMEIEIDDIGMYQVKPYN